MSGVVNQLLPLVFSGTELGPDSGLCFRVGRNFKDSFNDLAEAGTQ